MEVIIMRLSWIVRLLVLSTALLPTILPAQDLSNSSTYPQIRVIAGSDSDFMMVRHIILRGSNYEIGQQMASFAKSSGISMTPAQELCNTRT